MKLQDIEREALRLSDRDRGELILSLLRTLPAPDPEVTDEEVVRRNAEQESGRVEPMLHEEFVRCVQEERVR